MKLQNPERADELIKENTGKCEACGDSFIAFEMNWDGAYEKDTCPKCYEKKKQEEEKHAQLVQTLGTPIYRGENIALRLYENEIYMDENYDEMDEEIANGFVDKNRIKEIDGRLVYPPKIKAR